MDKNIRQLINDNYLDEANSLLQERLAANSNDDEAYYLLGNLYRKKGDFRQATHYYLTAVEINPNSPAVQAQRTLEDIRNFINPDFNP